MLIVRCIGENSFYVEKVVLPSEIIAFEAPHARGNMGNICGVHIEHTLIGDSILIVLDKEMGIMAKPAEVKIDKTGLSLHQI